jgi:hypothetical protein
MHRYSEVSLTFFNRKEVLKKPQKEDTVRRPHENRRMIFIPQPNDPSSGIGFKSRAGHTAQPFKAQQRALWVMEWKMECMLLSYSYTSELHQFIKNIGTATRLRSEAT